MGTGIMAAIPLVFKPFRQRNFEEDYFARGFFDNFAIDETSVQKTYIIKEDLLINNYKSFLSEFYELIGEDFFKATKLTLDSIPDAKGLDVFSEVFNGNNRNNCVPFIYDYQSMFSVLGCQCEEYWLFYSGSYKAYLEEYSILLHFEKVLAKTMKNPLANAVKFGIFG